MKNPRRNAYMSRVYQQMLDDLHYPVAKDGSIMDASAIKAWVAWHLVRTGWRKPNNTDGLALVEEFDDPIIKKRRISAAGVVEDAIEWVGVNEPDDPLANLADMTMGQIEALPEVQRIEAKRRLGLLPPPDTDAEPEPAWSVKTFIQIADEDDVDDGTQWA